MLPFMSIVRITSHPSACPIWKHGGFVADTMLLACEGAHDISTIATNAAAKLSVLPLILIAASLPQLLGAPDSPPRSSHGSTCRSVRGASQLPTPEALANSRPVLMVMTTRKYEPGRDRWCSKLGKKLHGVMKFVSQSI